MCVGGAGGRGGVLRAGAVLGANGGVGVVGGGRKVRVWSWAKSIVKVA